MANNTKKDTRTVLEKRIDEEMRLEALQDEKANLLERIRKCEKNIVRLKKKEKEEQTQQIEKLVDEGCDAATIASAVKKLQEEKKQKEEEAKILKEKKEEEKKQKEEKRKQKEEERREKEKEKRKKEKEEKDKENNTSKKEEQSQADTAEQEEKKKGVFGGFRK